jgi:hypothetical protein
VLILVTGTTLSAAPQAAEIVRSVIGGGGGRLEQGTYTLNGTIGQPVVGTAQANRLMDSAPVSGVWEEAVQVPTMRSICRLLYKTIEREGVPRRQFTSKSLATF